MKIAKIEILGIGCEKCRKLEENAKEAVKELKITAQINKIEDIIDIAGYGVMITPAIVINGIVRCSGRIASVLEIKGWLKE